MTIEEKQKLMKQNSTAWHGASAEEQNRLHQENIKLQQEIDAANKTTSSFNSNTGTWTSSPQTAAKTPETDDLGNVDYSQRWDSAMSGGADYDELYGIYNDRENKIKGDSIYGQFAGDAKSEEMKSVLDQMKAEADAKKQQEESDAYIRDLNQRKQEMILAELRTAYDKNVAGLDRAQAAIAPQYQSARNEAAGQAELQRRNFAEYAAANGLNSGAGGQAQLSFANTLQNSLNNISTKEASTLADLELQRSQMETDFNNAIASAKAQGNYELAQQLYQEKVRQDEALRQQMQWQAQMDLQNQQMQFSKDQAAIGNDQWEKQFGTSSSSNDREWAYKMAQEMAQYGNFDGYKALGYSDEEIQSMKDYWEWMKGQSTGRAAAGGGGTNTGRALTAKEALTAYNSGYDSPEIRAAIESVYGRTWRDDASDGANSSGDTGMDSASFNGLVSGIQSMMRTGSNSDAAALFAANVERMSESQINYLKSVLGI